MTAKLRMILAAIGGVLLAVALALGLISCLVISIRAKAWPVWPLLVILFVFAWKPMVYTFKRIASYIAELCPKNNP